MNIAHQDRGGRLSPASRISSIGVSEILKIGARAQAMKREGKPVIILGAGEPDFDTPDHVKQAAWQAIERGQDQIHRARRHTGAEGGDPRKVQP